MPSGGLLGLDGLSGHGVQIGYLAGTIDVKDQNTFQKIIFRASRGKVLSYFAQQPCVLRDADGTEIHRTVYVLVYQLGSYLKEKVHRICE